MIKSEINSQSAECQNGECMEGWEQKGVNKSGQNAWLRFIRANLLQPARSEIWDLKQKEVRTKKGNGLEDQIKDSSNTEVKEVMVALALDPQKHGKSQQNWNAKKQLCRCLPLFYQSNYDGWSDDSFVIFSFILNEIKHLGLTRSSLWFVAYLPLS